MYLNIVQRPFKQVILYIVLAVICIGSFIFVSHNASFYDRSIAKVVETELIEKTAVTDFSQNKDKLYTERLIAEIRNGKEKGQRIELMNEYSYSGAYDQKYKIGNELFVSIHKNTNGNPILTGTIKDVKRDKYVVIIAWVFIFTILIVGKKQGLYSVISLVTNAALLSFALDMYVKHSNISLVIICGVTAIFFTVISLFLVNGINEKTYAAIVATMLGTFASLFITYIVIWVTGENGLRYEEMQFISRPYQMIFMAGLFVGSLGAVMDIAITMSASIFEIYEKNPHVSLKALRKSGMEIGKDVMGTMTSILFFVYISGSLPMLILYLKNAAPLGFTLSMNLSLELARALAGGIGIVLTIPIGLYTAIYFVQRKKARV